MSTSRKSFLPSRGSRICMRWGAQWPSSRMNTWKIESSSGVAGRRLCWRPRSTQYECTIQSEQCSTVYLKLFDVNRLTTRPHSPHIPFFRRVNKHFRVSVCNRSCRAHVVFIYAKWRSTAFPDAFAPRSINIHTPHTAPFPLEI